MPFSSGSQKLGTFPLHISSTVPHFPKPVHFPIVPDGSARIGRIALPQNGAGYVVDLAPSTGKLISHYFLCYYGSDCDKLLRMDHALITHGQTTSGYVLTGLDAIAAQFNRHPTTIKRWIRSQGFIAPKLPNGQYATSFGLIDKWLLDRAKATEGQ